MRKINCKNCIHFNVCAMCGDEDDIRAMTFCSSFKDTSRILDLPCGIGDTVYVFDDKAELVEYKIIDIFFSTANYSLWLKVKNNDSIQTLLFNHYNQYWFTDNIKELK